MYNLWTIWRVVCKGRRPAKPATDSHATHWHRRRGSWDPTRWLTISQHCCRKLWSPDAKAGLIKHVRSIAPTGYKTSSHDSLVSSQFIRPLPLLILGDFLCNVCDRVIDKPVELKCNHLYCADCLIQEVSNSQLLSCRSCNSSVSEASDLHLPHGHWQFASSVQLEESSSSQPVSNHDSNCSSEMTTPGHSHWHL